MWVYCVFDIYRWIILDTVHKIRWEGHLDVLTSIIMQVKPLAKTDNIQQLLYVKCKGGGWTGHKLSSIMFRYTKGNMLNSLIFLKLSQAHWDYELQSKLSNSQTPDWDRLQTHTTSSSSGTWLSSVFRLFFFFFISWLDYRSSYTCLAPFQPLNVDLKYYFSSADFTSTNVLQLIHTLGLWRY